MSTLGDVFSFLEEVRRKDALLGLLAYSFFQSYAHGRYEDAAVWGRKTAEYVASLVLAENSVDDEYLALSESLEKVWFFLEYLAVPDIVVDGPLLKYVNAFGMHLPNCSIIDSMHVLRWYGNEGAHFHPLLKRRLPPYPAAVVCMLRVLTVGMSYLERALLAPGERAPDVGRSRL